MRGIVGSPIVRTTRTSTRSSAQARAASRSASSKRTRTSSSKRGASWLAIIYTQRRIRASAAACATSTTITSVAHRAPAMMVVPSAIWSELRQIVSRRDRSQRRLRLIKEDQAEREAIPPPTF